MTWDNDLPPNPPAPPAPPVSNVPPPPPPPAPPAPSWSTVPPAPTAPAVPGPTAPSSGGAGTPPFDQPWNVAPTPPPDRRHVPQHASGKRSNPISRVLVAIVVVVGLFGLGFGVRSIVDDPKSASTVSTVIGTNTSGTTVTPVTIDPGAEPVAYAAAVVSPSVVLITTSDGLGSGVVFDTDLVMTNAHVVGNATSVSVQNVNGVSLRGEVLGADTSSDIAVVRVPGLDAPVAALATEMPHVGQIAVAVGSPFGLEQTVTSGIVSAINRPVDTSTGVVVNMIQTDASINPGNSGGALADRNGAVIGINSVIISQSGENNGIGFAIPISTAKRVADKLVAGQAIVRAGLNLSGPSMNSNGDAGAYVQSVTPGGAADNGGIEAGDVIVSVDGQPIRSFDELRGTINAYSPGDVVTIQVVRDGTALNLQVTLGSLR